MAQTRIFLQGDSTTYGYSGGDAAVGWGDLLKQTMIRRAHEGELPAREVINLAVSSQTTDEITQRLDGQVAAFRGVGNIAIFLLGAADSLVLKDQNQPRVPVERFATNLACIGDICTANSIDPIFVECGHVNEALTHPWRGGRTVSNLLIKERNDEMRAYAATRGLSFVSLRAFNEAFGSVSSDGAHPSALGHRIIHDLVVPEIDRVLYG